MTRCIKLGLVLMTLLTAIPATPASAQNLICQGSFCRKSILTCQRTTVSDAAYAAAIDDCEIAYTILTATRVVTLVDPATLKTGQRVWVKDESGSPTAAIKITLTPANSATIDGSASLNITVAFGSVELASDGTNYKIVASNLGGPLGASTITAAVTATDALDVTATSLTSGAALKVTGGGANLLTTGITGDFEMGAATVGSGVKIVTSGVYTDTAAAPLWVSAPSATTPTFGLARVDGAGLTTGSALVVKGGSEANVTTSGRYLSIQDNAGAELFAISADGHQVFAQTTLPVVSNTGGSGPSCVGCTDTNGKLVVTTAANTNVITLTFNKSATPRGCTIAAADANTAVDLKAAGGGIVVVGAGTFTISSPAANWAATQKNIYYSCFF